MQITFLARKSALIYRRGLRQRVASLTIDCNGVFAIRAYAAFWWCRIYRVYDFRVGNNVLVTSQLVFTSHELVKKNGAPVGEWLATFPLFRLSPMQKAGNNGTEKLLSTLDRVSCTNYFISIEIIRCSVRWIETTKPDKKQCVAKAYCIFSI